MAENKNSPTVGKVYDLAQPLADSLGLELWDIRFEKEGAQWYLRVYIDKEEGISLDDCEALSRPLGKLLDDVDPIDISYIFEVGSPGLGRRLLKPTHFEKFIDSPVTAKLFKAIDSVREISGLLSEYNKETIVIKKESGESYEIRLADAAYVKLDDDSDLF